MEWPFARVLAASTEMMENFMMGKRLNQEICPSL